MLLHIKKGPGDSPGSTAGFQGTLQPILTPIDSENTGVGQVLRREVEKAYVSTIYVAISMPDS
jgi:hypothetical protein